MTGARILATSDAPRPALVAVPDVELLAVGRWDAHTWDGRKATVTADDLTAMVAASRDPHIRPPVVKLGHDDPRFNAHDGDPSLGTVANLRVSDDGMKLLGDLVGVPAWLADILASAYPRRSAEWYQAYMTDTGRDYDAVLTAVALLGTSYPAVETLEDIKALYSDDGPELIAAAASHGDRVVATERRATVAPIAARVADDEVIRAFYDQLPHGDWSWVVEMYIDPTELIVQTEEGDLYRQPFTTADSGVTFGERVRVRREYIDVPADRASAASTRTPVRVFASRAESRPTNDEQEETAVMDVDTTLLRRKLGLPEDATEDQITAALAAEPTEPEGRAGDEEPNEDGSGAPAAEEQPAGDPIAAAATRQISDLSSEVADLKAREARRVARETVDRQHSKVEASINDARITPADRDYFRRLMQIDEEGTTAILNARAAGSAMPLDPRGTAAEPVDDSHDDLVGEDGLLAAGVSLLTPAQRARATAR